MEQNQNSRGLFAAIGIVALIIGVLIGIAIPRGTGRSMVANRMLIGHDFRTGNHLGDLYEYRSYRPFTLRATVYDGYYDTRTNSSSYEYVNTSRTINFYPNDCMSPGRIDQLARELGSQFDDFARYCESIGQPIG